MKSMHKIALPLCLTSCLFIAVQAAEPQQEPALAVTVVALDKISEPVERSVEAELVTLNDTVVSSQLAAQVEEIHANVGDEVSQGDVLARLDCRDFDVAVRQAKAGVATVQARIAATAARTGASESRVSAAGSRVNATAARVKAATANMQSVGTRINTAKSQVNTAKAQAGAAGARLPAAQAQLRLAQAQLKRNQQLRDKKLIPVDLFDQARANYDSSNSNLKAAQADAGAARAAVATANAGISEAQGAFRAAQSEVEAAKADLATSRAEVDTHKANADISTSEVDTAKADVQTASAEHEAAKADLMAAETELETARAQLEAAEVVAERCDITAPFDGQITARPFQLGQIAAPGTAAFQVLQTGDLEVSARLSADEIRDQEDGEAIRFVAEGDEIEVELRAIIAQVDKATGTQEVRFEVKDLHDFPVGQSGRLRWQGKLPSVPPDWLLRREGGLGLMLAVEGKAEFYPLKNAREGQPALVDLPKETLLINDNRLRARHGQTIERVKP